jgi:hypothetical protein
LLQFYERQIVRNRCIVVVVAWFFLALVVAIQVKFSGLEFEKEFPIEFMQIVIDLLLYFGERKDLKTGQGERSYCNHRSHKNSNK